jgi:hypothetical protein
VLSIRYGLTTVQTQDPSTRFGNVYGGLTRERIAKTLSWTISKLRSPLAFTVLRRYLGISVLTLPLSKQIAQTSIRTHRHHDGL